jgi:hypothetical protein
LKPPLGVLADDVFRAEQPEPVLHQGQQIADLSVRAFREALSEENTYPQRFQSLGGNAG